MKDKTFGALSCKIDKMRFSALYVKEFRLFWLAQVVSFSGTWIHSTAQGWLVYSLTGSPLYLGLVSAASSLPVTVFVLFGGVVADRFRKRNLLLLTQAISILPPLVIGLLTTMGVINVWEVMVLAALLGAINAFDIPARQSFLVEMVQKGRLLNAIALNSMAFNGARMIGPVIAGYVITRLGLSVCFYLNSMSFLAMISALFMMKSGPKVEIFERRSVLSEFSDAMKFVAKDKDVLRILLMVITFSIFGIPFITLLPVFAEDILHVGAQGLGFLAGSAGLGAFVAASVLSFKAEVHRKELVMRVASLLFPISLLVFSLSKDYHFSMICLVLTGLGVVNFIALANNALQMKAPDEMRGRVMSVYTLVFLGMTPIGNAIMGTLAEFLGTSIAISLAASLCIVVSLIVGSGIRVKHA